VDLRAYLPRLGKAAGIVMLRRNSEAMSIHLEKITFHIAPGTHAVILLDKTGWHRSAGLIVPPEHHAHAAAAQLPRVQPCREGLADHARQPLGEPHPLAHEDSAGHCCFVRNKHLDQLGTSCPSASGKGHKNSDQCTLKYPTTSEAAVFTNSLMLFNSATQDGS